MANQVAMAGSQSQKQKNRKYAPIWVNRFISGYWPNRNPLRDASLPVLQEKFYGALNDALIDGLNCEINNRSELTRRAGLSTQYDGFFSNTIPAQNFYSFPVFGTNGSSTQKVLMSTNANILELTNPNFIYARPQLVNTVTTSSITLLNVPSAVNVASSLNMFVGQTLTVDSGASQESVVITNILNIGPIFQITAVFTKTHITGTPVKAPYSSNVVFQAIGDTVFFADQTDPQQIIYSPNSWVANTVITGGEVIVDSNQNLQTNLGSATSVTNISISSGVSSNRIMTVTYSGYLPVLVNNTIILSNINYAPLAFLDGQPFIVTGTGAGTFTCNIVTTTTGGSALSATVYLKGSSSAGSTGATAPTWSEAYQGVTLDNNTAWLYSGPQIRNVGIIGPTQAPIVTNTPASPVGNAWAASTYYFPGQIIFDSTGTTVQQLSTAGTTAGSPPTFSTTVGATTTDGSATWTCVSSGAGNATRTTTTNYALNALVLITWSKTIIVGYTTGLNGDVPGGNKIPPRTPIYGTISYSAFFQCAQAGNSSSTATATQNWPLSGTFSDGTVVWTFVGLEVKRGTTSTSPAVSGTSFTNGTIGNSTLVSIFGTPITISPNSGLINDAVGSGGGPGNLQTVSLAGISGSTHPTWPTAVGSNGQTTVDGGVSWISTGSSGSSANTGYWTYAYAYVSSSTPDVSSASPLSIPIIRAANSYVSISGTGSSILIQQGIDTIRIYRSTQQATNAVVSGQELFWLADIPAPSVLIGGIAYAGASWNYVDSSNDPPDPNSTLDNEIIADTVGVNTPPSLNITNFVYYLGRLWGSVGNTVYASAGPDVLNGGNPYTAFPPDNFMDFSHTVVRMVASSQGLFVYTSSGVQVITGNGVAPTGSFSGFTTFIPVSFAPGISLGGYNCLAIDGGTTYIYTTDRNLVSLSSSGLNWISIAIADHLLQPFTLPDTTVVNFNPPNCYLSWYVNGDDYGLFLSDGKTGWFRMMPSTSPDAGNMVWSPFAQVVGGISAMQTIEVTPGINRLLFGPAIAGLHGVVYRDPTVYWDDGFTFSWYATFGSVVLAHPGEYAMVQAITIDSIATGSHPTITVYFDEISGANGYTYTNWHTDPYTAPQSSSVYSDRFYMSDQPNACAICRHLQFKIAFPAELDGNTVLSSTIIGATEYDN